MPCRTGINKAKIFKLQYWTYYALLVFNARRVWPLTIFKRPANKIKLQTRLADLNTTYASQLSLCQAQHVRPTHYYLVLTHFPLQFLSLRSATRTFRKRYLPRHSTLCTLFVGAESNIYYRKICMPKILQRRTVDWHHSHSRGRIEQTIRRHYYWQMSSLIAEANSKRGSRIKQDYDIKSHKTRLRHKCQSHSRGSCINENTTKAEMSKSRGSRHNVKTNNLS